MAMKSVSSDLGGIKPISKGDVHRICSGQVVLTVATAVKELVENSLDAGASVVDIRLKDYGSELIEVSDNGSGVHSDNFQALTLKHHTSKLQDFSDLLTVETFGFRGEALSSLCALSEVTITTRHSSSQCGTRLVYNSDGIITSSSSVARQVGTTVTLKDIFSTIPVRQKEFHRNLKREFAKMCQLLYAYCLVSTDVKITCTNLSKKGRKSTIVSTQSGSTVRGNIASIFGVTQPADLLDWKYRTSDDGDDKTTFHLEGVISSCAHGCGRSAPDRQFFYINSRPCEPTKVMRVVNEVYHQYNAHQSPFVFLNIKVPRSRVDVNVTPDKRQIFLDQEKVLLDVIRESLQKLYERIPSTLAVNNISKHATRHLSNNVERIVEHNLLNSIKESLLSEDATKSIEESVTVQIQKESRISINNYEFKLTEEEQKSLAENDVELTDVGVDNNSIATEGECISGPSSVEQQSNIEMDETIEDLDKKEQEVINDIPSTTTFNQWKHSENYKRPADEIAPNNKKKPKQMKLGSNMKLIQGEDKMKQFQGIELRKVGEKIHQLFSSKSSASKSACKQMEAEERVSDQNEIPNNDNPSIPCANLDSQSILKEKEILDCKNVDLFKGTNSKCNSSIVDSGYSSSEASENMNSHDELALIASKTDDHYDNEVSRPKRTLRISLDDIKSLHQKSIDEHDRKTTAFVRFRALIDPTNNKQAEQELTREISKDMFVNMDVIGQFNLGFIIALHKSDLFIVDQHATDEKYNFEMLQKTTTLSNQRLVVPQKLELTPINESILMENIEIFRSNGFEFQIDEDALPTQKVSLTAIPMSNNWTFGKEDIDELLFMLQDSPHTLCRPSRVRAMFASRACRKSVMIGTALTKSKMKTLLTHMGEIEQPWNCPHGRPTMRHLVNLDVFK